MSMISGVSFIDVVRDTGRLGGQIYPLIVAVNDQKSVVARVGMGNPPPLWNRTVSSTKYIQSSLFTRW